MGYGSGAGRGRSQGRLDARADRHGEEAPKRLGDAVLVHSAAGHVHRELVERKLGSRLDAMEFKEDQRADEFDPLVAIDEGVVLHEMEEVRGRRGVKVRVEVRPAERGRRLREG